MELRNKYSLGFFPTPLHPMENLSKVLPDYNLFIKRDDQSGLASGGNKVRKLEYLIQQAIDEGCNIVITAGAQQSNHCRQTAAACVKAGLECHLLLGGTEPEVLNGNLLMSSLLGAKIHYCGDRRHGEDMPALKDQLEKEGNKCMSMPCGGSTVTGTMGFVNAVKELKLQLEEQDLQLDYIFHASSSGATQAGLVLGKELYGLDAQLIPINIDKDSTNGLPLDHFVLDLVKQGQELLGLVKEFTLEDVAVIKDYDKSGYGVMSYQEKEAIEILAKHEGIFLDPVYTGRAFAGMLDYLRNNKIEKGTNVMFWHTGGFPALFEYGSGLKQ
ncbi:D-cysteine desulfhydrase family protein [Puteibacter caeruleilacunae]|nr:D-cysteine desulfhydrase family protein [Puteibacter caeruleilacunae]